eukprot:122871_1
MLTKLICFFSVLFCIESENNTANINNFVIPIQWSEISIPNEHTSMSTIIDAFGNTYLCGGKVSLFDKSNKCIGIYVDKIVNNFGETNYSIVKTFSGGNGLKSAGPFPGLFFNAKSFTSESQNEGGIYNDRMCMLSISDGTNKPKCWCCNINELNLYNKNYLSKQPSKILCDDLQYTINDGCPERFEACVIHDNNNDMLYQIGGYYGQLIYDSILCFDLITETYFSDPINCKYGNLSKPMYAVGC